MPARRAGRRDSGPSSDRLIGRTYAYVWTWAPPGIVVAFAVMESHPGARGPGPEEGAPGARVRIGG
ncbi:hypothetical protein AMK32_29720 [Streptomyces sp. CB01883]|nr:hypothetical protein AMK32_29720 [Streptomyces sp. CB01883]